MKSYETVEEYIGSFPTEIQITLEQLRKAIKSNAPDAIESMSYGMPGYKLNNKPLVYFGGFKKHIGFFPTPNGIKTFEKELSKYKTSKGTAQFPLDQPLPMNLITQIIKYRVSEALKK